jgi:hypothetical protein
MGFWPDGDAFRRCTRSDDLIESESGSLSALDDCASALEGYVIAPIPFDQYTPKLETNANQYREIFPRRAGLRPLTTRHEPHQQITQHGKAELWDEMISRSAALPDVTVMDSMVSVPGAMGLFLDESVPKGPADAFHIEREFAHIHPRPDGSLHLQLPMDLAALAMGAGWGEPHTYVFRGLSQPNSIMLYAARTAEELDVIWMLVEESYRYARGEPAQFSVAPERNA